jgi:drug/metabolite transporter (DMT)-like permease
MAPGSWYRLPRSSTQWGLAAIVSAAVVFGCLTPAARHLTDEGVSFIELNEARAWLTGLALLPFLLRAPEPAPRVPLTRAECLSLLGMAAGFAATNNLTIYAATRMPVAVAVVITYLAPALVVLWRWFRTGKRPNAFIALAVASALAGMVLLSGLTESRTETRRLDSIGLVSALGAAVGFALLLTLGEKMTRTVGAGRSVCLGYLVLGLCYLAYQVPRGLPDSLLRSGMLPWVLALGLLGTALPYFLLNWGMNDVDVRIASAVATLEVVTAAVVATLWLGETLAPWEIVGAVLVLTGAVTASSQAGRL